MSALAAGSVQPVLDREPRYAREVAHVAGDEGRTPRRHDGRDAEIGVRQSQSRSFQLRPQRTVSLGGSAIEVEDADAAEQLEGALVERGPPRLAGALGDLAERDRGGRLLHHA